MTSNSDVRHDIQSTLSTAPDFNSTNITATVSEDSVVLSGYAVSQEQKDSALSVASQYAGDRQIVDQIQLGGSSSSGD